MDYESAQRVIFQFNPEQLTRNRSVDQSLLNVRKRHKRKHKTLRKMRDEELLQPVEETMSFDIRLDAGSLPDRPADEIPENETDKQRRKREEEAVLAQTIAPQLAALELMMYPRPARLKKGASGKKKSKKGHSYSKQPKPPVILLIWGKKRVLPVHITSLNITESEFTQDLLPIRATISVNLTVLEGKNDTFTNHAEYVVGLADLYKRSLPEVAKLTLP